MIRNRFSLLSFRLYLMNRLGHSDLRTDKNPFSSDS